MKEKPDYFRQAMAAPTSLAEFKGNVTAVESAPFWDQPLADLAAEMGVVNKSAYYLAARGKSHLARSRDLAHVEDATAQHRIAASAGSGGSISPAGTESYLPGTTFLYTITPKAGHYV